MRRICVTITLNIICITIKTLKCHYHKLQHENVASATNKANSILDTIKKTFSCLDSVIIKDLCKPHQPSAWIWKLRKITTLQNGHLQKFEQVQRRATTLIPELRDRFYQDRLTELRFTFLYHRQNLLWYKLSRLVMIPVDKILTAFSKSVTRRRNFKLQKQSCRLDLRKYFFASHVVNDWNSLPVKVLNAETINQFKDWL